MRVRRCLIALGCLLSAELPAADPSPGIHEGWRMLSRYLYRDARDALEKVDGGDRRIVDLGRAASLLNDPPVTLGKMRQAEALLRVVINQCPTDETASHARYLLTRIKRARGDASVAEIEEGYRAVIEHGPPGPVSQLAAGHLALVLLYQRPDLTVTERIAAARELEPVAVSDGFPEVSIAFYRTLANACLFYERVDTQVMAWLGKAHAIGSSDELLQIDLTLQIAETARATGLRELALRYYREFLTRAIATDPRYQTVRMRLEEVEGLAP